MDVLLLLNHVDINVSISSHHLYVINLKLALPAVPLRCSNTGSTLGIWLTVGTSVNEGQLDDALPSMHQRILFDRKDSTD